MNNILVLFFIVICDVLGTIPQLFWFSIQYVMKVLLLLQS